MAMPGRRRINKWVIRTNMERNDLIMFAACRTQVQRRLLQNQRQRPSVNLLRRNLQADQLRERWCDIDGLDRRGLLEALDASPPEQNRHATVITPGRAM